MSNNDDARALLGPLAGEPAGAQRLDLTEIIRAGDKRRRTRTWGTTALAVVAVAAVGAGTAVSVRNAAHTSGVPMSSPSAPSPSGSAPAPDRSPAPVGAECRSAFLPGPTTVVHAVDHTGRYVLEEQKSSGGKVKAVVWRGGAKVSEVTLPTFTDASYALNGKGDFVVTITSATGRTTPYVYADGSLTALKGGNGVAVAITDNGRIAGSQQPGSAVVWQSPDAEPTKLALPDGYYASGADGMDESGTVIGYLQGGGSTKAALWLPDGSVRELPAPVGRDERSLTGIANGWAVGSDTVPGQGFVTGFRYNVVTGKSEELPAQFGAPQVAGGEGNVIGLYDDAKTYVYLNGVARPLGRAPVDGLLGALGISDDGRTVTGSIHIFTQKGDRNSGRAVTWTCD
ncbi:hypothetical protein [Winogradskya humida]|uniref:HAF family extracellular repeat protein n=1 Tax=Winogradskya humida TaxID=113566 RepID=A0ABQ3ZFT7_9ACTN|nr:hypothetical protein [Actinoplanes humidus]GIE17435.1 hypothetical protein Ahu01nite_005370 [Actinoplanes humidus]